jgi:hypothetical protein
MRLPAGPAVRPLRGGLRKKRTLRGSGVRFDISMYFEFAILVETANRKRCRRASQPRATTFPPGWATPGGAVAPAAPSARRCSPPPDGGAPGRGLITSPHTSPVIRSPRWRTRPAQGDPTGALAEARRLVSAIPARLSRSRSPPPPTDLPRTACARDSWRASDRPPPRRSVPSDPATEEADRSALPVPTP